MQIPVKEACNLIFYPHPASYERERDRNFQGCPTIAVTSKGRIFLGWYSGGFMEPHMDNYNLVISSEDGGKTWSDPILLIPSDKERLIHALDIQLWIDPLGRLWVFWVEERVRKSLHPQDGLVVDGYSFTLDKLHGMWGICCENPDAQVLEWSAPKRLDDGFLRCRPTVLKNGSWFFCNYDQTTDHYGYSITWDQGKTFQRYYGAEKIPTPFDEAMVVEKKEGTLWMMARTFGGHIAQAFSQDGGVSWSETTPSAFPNPSTRFYFGRTPSGNLLLVNNQHEQHRTALTALLSQDEGVTWHSLLIDNRMDISYPDVDYYDGKIYLTYDFERTKGKEIILCVLKEEDILRQQTPSLSIISKPDRPQGTEHQGYPLILK